MQEDPARTTANDAKGGAPRREGPLLRSPSVTRSGYATKTDGSGFVVVCADGTTRLYDNSLSEVSWERWDPATEDPELVEIEAATRGAPQGDAVVMPPHYTRFEIEPIRFVVENFGPSFLVGNIIKYIMRYDAKNGVEDLLKAERYTRMLRAFVQKDPDWWKADKSPAQDSANG